ncbi:MAG: hypothetical protein ACTHJQ_23815 [Rhizobiaceae bacterium]|jgi:hypothetical protein
MRREAQKQCSTSNIDCFSVRPGYLEGKAPWTTRISDIAGIASAALSGGNMPRTPNYNFERKERERIKAAKKAEKRAVKEAKKTSEPVDEQPDPDQE